MQIVHTPVALQNLIQKMKSDGARIGFVPTMGALHTGHLSLVKLALEHTDRCVVSIFVNPKQFAPHEDFDAYPRDMEGDLGKLEKAGADIVYMPGVECIYPPGFATHFDVGGAGLGLDSNFRPHFFSGVAVVVCKLFNQVRPDLAVFGEKDYQQLCVIRQMVKDLDMNVEILGGPLVRDENGLALSSRNQYLSESEYETACHLNRILFSLATEIRQHPAEVDEIIRLGVQAIYEAGFKSVDYLELCAENTLAPLSQLSRSARLLFAGWVGKTRLLDNVEVKSA